MKTETKGCCSAISKEELERLTTEVKECIAFECLNQKKVFSSAELWNIQRQRKSASLKRNYV